VKNFWNNNRKSLSFIFC